MAETATTKKTSETKQRSYFTNSVVNRYLLDDGVSYIEHKKLNEGDFQSYQDLTSRIRLDREGDSTEVDMALGKQRKFLLEKLVTGWNLVDEDGKAIRYSPGDLLELPPHILTGLVDDIYKCNEILSSGPAGQDDTGK